MLKPIIEGLGGKTLGTWMSFGEYDMIGIGEMPDNVGAAAFALAISATGICKSFKTTPLMTIDEGIEAMKKAATAASGFRPPGN